MFETLIHPPGEEEALQEPSDATPCPFELQFVIYLFILSVYSSRPNLTSCQKRRPLSICCPRRCSHQ